MKFFNKNHKIYANLALILTLALGSIFLAAHSFSHKTNTDFAKISNFVKAAKATPDKAAKTEANDCALCFFANNFHQTSLPALAAVVLGFFLTFLTQISNRVKLAYLTLSFSSRAPPSFINN